ncbi:DNA-binding transcriptional ArsR family regulator [Arthrobacter sp. CAN_A212]|uniref:MarR family transcriptional regulator n=1 Tax=Arthrobacter sp. CAN_A212 TaxID=2787719 RepID=UPI001A3529B9
MAPAGQAQVDADVRHVTTWLHRHGARWIADHSPSGGRHIYVPLARRVGFSEARDLVEALGASCPSLDKSQHQNLKQGCMRVPGSRHKTGGYQELDMSLNLAYDVVRRPNSAGVWEALIGDLGAEINAVRQMRIVEPYTSAITGEKEDRSLDTSPVAGLSHRILDIAQHGVYDTARYSSASEARMAVITAAAASGMKLTDVELRVRTGIWPGLAQFYSRYRGPSRFKSMKADWDNVLRFIQTQRKLDKKQANQPAKSNTHKSPTSRLPSHGAGLQGGNSLAANSNESPAEHQFILNWRNALTIAEHRYHGSRSGLVRRMLLRAMGAAARMTGSRFIEFGSRSYAVATGQDHTTVAAHLRELRTESDALVTLIERGKGTHGDQYMLTIPEDLIEPASSLAWRKGKIHALRAAFRELGLPAAYVYEELERAPLPRSTAELVRATGLSRTAVSEALEILAAWNLTTRSPAGVWSVNTTTNLDLIAEQLGVMDQVHAQIARHRAERARWRQWLGSRILATLEPLSPGEDYPWDAYERPPDDWELADLAFSARAG